MKLGKYIQFALLYILIQGIGMAMRNTGQGMDKRDCVEKETYL